MFPRSQRAACYSFTVSLMPVCVVFLSTPLLLNPSSPDLPQICVGKSEEADGFLRLTSGKKRGLVPVKYLMEI